MTDANLMIFGDVIVFIALAGAYVYLRGRFSEGPEQGQLEPAKVRAHARPERVRRGRSA